MLQRLVGLPRLSRRLKKKWQWAADLAGTYGSDVLGRISHECRVGLWLNRERIGFQRAWDTWQGAIVASGERVMPLEMWEAVTECPEQAQLEYRRNLWLQSAGTGPSQ